MSGLEAFDDDVGVGGELGQQFTSFRDNFAVRFGLRTSSWQVSELCLGAGAYSEGLDTSTLLPQYKGVGILRGEQGVYGGARDAFERSVEYARQARQPSRLARTLSNLGNIALYSGDERLARAVILALGVRYRRLPIPAPANYEGLGVTNPPAWAPSSTVDGAGSAGIKSKIEPWPARRSACCFWPHASALSSTVSIPLRVPGSAPHLTSASRTRLFDTDASTRSVKSQIDSNGPPSSRAAISMYSLSDRAGTA